jgi:predicted GIY-YIG superfamily endonuclease
MAETTFMTNEEQLKAVFKAALIEVIEEKRDFFQELLEDAIEEIALVRAIEEGKQTETISREEVFKRLEVKT